MFNGFFDIILFAAFAVFMAMKLYNVLGRREFDSEAKKSGNVVMFPDKTDAAEAKFEEVKEDYEELKKEHGPEIARKIKEIRKYDPSFTDKVFLNGARSAFEIIIKAFSAGDSNALKPLLGTEVYNGFLEEINKRQRSGKVEETTLVSVLASNIKSVALNKKYAKIVVEIVSEQISIIRDKKGKIVEGDPSQVDQISEEWTFARNLSSPNPNWELVETGGVKG